MKRNNNNKVCELCSEEASLYCHADSAFLCRSCDADVHGANFLVARHVRRTICSSCFAFDGSFVSGAAYRRRNRSELCRVCSSENSSLSSDSPSICVSSTTSESKRRRVEDRVVMKERIGSSSSVTDLSGEEVTAPVRFAGEVSSEKTKTKKEKETDPIGPRRLTSVDEKAEGIFGNWCRELGLDDNCEVVALALHALGFCVARSRVLPFRVSLAASFWYGLRACGEKSAARTFHGLRRLQEVSGVPAKLIVAVEFKLAEELRVRKTRRHDDLEEGWAECSA
ncbi:B-box-type zinc finger [Parasponia andersonii]|uniref:B-box-type zinc finger n=1 Tax=Parasponia andersonii TaxID=3476 RepID=A0A2P5BWL9_PARAD|nr:B-box-type zinc finger [Parasponia andersonii]